MCKCCQSCLETIWWHLIEKRFCYDDSIALYEVPEKQEKNNNMFENMAFFDSVSIIAGRSVVTIDPLLEKLPIPVMEQPRLSDIPTPPQRWQDRISFERSLSKSAPDITEKQVEEDIPDGIPTIETSIETSIEEFQMRPALTETTSDVNLFKPPKNSLDTIKSAGDLSDRNSGNLLSPPMQHLRKKSLLERRMSKSLYLKVECIGDQCREVPIIRQNSMPKFYLGTPEDHQIETAVFRTPSIALTSPIPATTGRGFVYDLSSVVQIEKERAFNCLPEVHDRGRKQFRDKIVRLRRIKILGKYGPCSSPKINELDQL